MARILEKMRVEQRPSIKSASCAKYDEEAYFVVVRNEPKPGGKTRLQQKESLRRDRIFSIIVCGWNPLYYLIYRRQVDLFVH